MLKSLVVRRLMHKANPFLAINHTPNQFITKWLWINVFGAKTVYFNKKCRVEEGRGGRGVGVVDNGFQSS